MLQMKVFRMNFLRNFQFEIWGVRANRFHTWMNHWHLKEHFCYMVFIKCIISEPKLLEMTEEYFYHYTSETAAIDIVLSGIISPSHAANGDAAHGDGVYLTTLDPRLGRETIKINKWDGLGRQENGRVL